MKLVCYSSQSYLFEAINYHLLFLPNVFFKELLCQGHSVFGKTSIVSRLGYTHPYVSNPCSSLFDSLWNRVRAVSIRMKYQEELVLASNAKHRCKDFAYQPYRWLELG